MLSKRAVRLFWKRLIFLPTLIFFLILLHSTLSLAQTGSIYITSKPSGADVSLDNGPIQKKTNTLIEDLPAGVHKIMVEHRDYRKAEKRVEIVEGLTATVHFDLQPKEIKKEAKKEVEKEVKKEVQKEAKKEETAPAEEEIKDADIYHSRGFTYFAKNQYDLAVADFTKAIELEPDLLAAYYNRGIAYFEMHKYELAVEDLSKAMDLGLKGKGAFYIRGVAYGKIGQYDLAIADLTKALELDPNDAIAYNSRGLIYLLKGQYKQTVADFTRATELDSRNTAEYNLHLGFVLDKMGDKEMARHNFFRAREMDKDIVKKTAEFLEKQTSPATMRLYAEEILSASQYIGVQPYIVTKAKEIVDQMRPELQSSLPSSSSSGTPSAKPSFARLVFYIALALAGALMLLALAIKFIPRRSRMNR